MLDNCTLSLVITMLMSSSIVLQPFMHSRIFLAWSVAIPWDWGKKKEGSDVWNFVLVGRDKQTY